MSLAIWLAVAAVVAVVVAACGPQATPSPSGGLPSGSNLPSGLESPGAGSPEPSASPGTSAAASSSPAPAARPIQPGIAATVLVPLNVRETPTTTAKKMGSLAKGDVVYLLGYGGIKAGGYTWFEAGRIKGLHGGLPALPAWPLQASDWTDLTGWIAIGSASSPYIAALAPRCGDGAATDLALLSAMLPGEELACLGSAPLTLQGTFGCGGCGGAYPGTFTPAWLAEPLSGPFSADFSSQVGPLQLYFPPGLTRPTEGSILRVHGHLDDSRAAKCKVAIPTSDSFLAAPVAVRAADAQAWCREHVVVDSYEVLGADPSYPPS
jgi:hypothetical protein